MSFPAWIRARRTRWLVSATPIPIRGHLSFWTWLAAILLAALALRVALALAIPTVHRPDEVFQTMEPAHRLVFGWGVVTWDWRDHIRSWLLPGLLALLMAISRAASSNPDGYLLLVPVAMSVLSLAIVASGFILGWRLYGLSGAILTGIACAIWPDLVFFAPKTLTEIQAAPFLTVAAVLACLMPWRGQGLPPASPAIGLAVGLCLGLAFCLRFQLVPAIGVVGLWAMAKSDRRTMIFLLFGSCAPVLLQGILDGITLGLPFQSFWKNYVINVIDGKAAAFGTSSVFGYATALAANWGAAIIPLGGLFLLGARRALVLALAAAAIFVSHSLIPHKEASFIFAAIPLVIIVAGLGSAEAVRVLPSIVRFALSPSAATAYAVGAWVLVAGLTGAVVMNRELRINHPDLLDSFVLVRAKPDLCGLALYKKGILWYQTGGYTYLNRPVPLSIIEDSDTRTDITEANYLIYNAKQTSTPSGWTLLGCFRNACVAHREQSCIANPATAINAVLERRHE